MAKLSNQRIKILKLWEILRQESDEENPLSTTALIDRLNDYGIPVDRKTLYTDIQLLNDNGYEICVQRGKENCYYVMERPFDTAELKILVDAVKASKFITEKKSKALIEKLAREAGDYKADILKKDVLFDTVKHNNEEVYYNVDRINEAITQKRKVSFFYFELNTKRQRVYRKGKWRYKVNPLAMVFNDGYYYLVGYMDRYENTVSYRIDRMEKVQVEESPISTPDWIKDIKGLQKQQFAMFGGKPENVELWVDARAVDAIIDKFGASALFENLPDGRFKVKVKVQISPTFFGWCFIFGDLIEIKSPRSVREQYLEVIKKTAQRNKITK